ncbi:MAG: gas vesicle protein GvpN [Chloroherpetonaceae bacterium]|nr:gas vesicle protein GvpN [Chloroherpetonaceae bacterium]
MNEDIRTIEAKPLPDFVETKYVKEVTYRAMTYIEAGFPIHLRGASGTGKTTLAMHLASKLGRPIMMMHGDSEYKTTDLIGGDFGYHSRKVVDRFQSRVLKVEEDLSKRWVDSRLTLACKYGFTLLYDEFTRSRPEANNVLLSVLQEKVLDMPNGRSGEDNLLKVHPTFTAVFTSNPEEYAGVHKTPDALRDRMVTIDLEHFDYETEIAIVIAKSGCSSEDAEEIVGIVRQLRDSGRCEFAPTVRAAIMISKTLSVQRTKVFQPPDFFLKICQDILSSETSRIGSKTNQDEIKQIVRRLVERTALHRDSQNGKLNNLGAKSNFDNLHNNLILLRQNDKRASGN